MARPPDLSPPGKILPFPLPCEARRLAPPSPEGPVSGPETHLSTLTLHQLRYGELDAEELPRAQAHLDTCAACRARLAEQQALRADFERRAPPIDFAALIAAEQAREEGPAADEVATSAPERHRDPAADPDPAPVQELPAANGRPGWARWTPVPLLLAAAVLIAVRVLPGAGVDPDGDPVDARPPVEDIRLKGAADVQVLVEGQGVLDPGESVRPGDRIQLRVPAGVGAEAWVGDGEELIGRFPLSADAPTLSPFALSVDGEAGDEELVVVITKDPIDRARATAAMRAAVGPDGAGRMPGVEIRRIALPKTR